MGLRVPIVNAPMGGVAGGRLAAAVTAAGGLGMVGMGTAGSTSSLHAELPHVTGTFGIGLVDWVIRKEPDLFDAALAARPVLISVSFGTDLSWVSRVHDAGIATATQVYNSVEARRAEDAGIDLLVARGSEGGGHGDATIGTLPLLDAVLEVVSVPVLAAGGIASARSLAAVLAAGASGAWLGTVLIGLFGGADVRRRPPRIGRGPRDRHHQHPGLRHRPWTALVGAVPVARAAQRLRRALERSRRRACRRSRCPAELAAAIAADDRRTAPVDAGQGVGMVTGVAPVGQVIERLCAGAEELLPGSGI